MGIGGNLYKLSKFVFSFTLFLLVAALFGQFAPVLEDKYEYPLHSWSWWTVQQIRWASNACGGEANSWRCDETNAAVRDETNSARLGLPAPNTVLLGSSLMVVANAETDATWRGKRIDLTTYRQAKYFDETVSTRLCTRSQTLNLASPGQIPSDAYLTLKEALNEGIRPSLVVYGVAPRDFIDSTMSSPFETESYKYLSRLVSTDDVDRYLDDGLPGSISRKIVSVLPLARHATDARLWLEKRVADWHEKTFSNENCISLEKRMSLLANYEPLDMVPEFIHAEVAKKSEVEKLYLDNLEDYKARYRKPRDSFYRGQLESFERLIELCKERRIELVVVNMPIQKCNIDLIDPDVFQKFLNDVEDVVESNGAKYVNLCAFDEYGKNDYRDSVHLNGFGGRKFINKLVSVLSETKLGSAPAIAGRGNHGFQL